MDCSWIAICFELQFIPLGYLLLHYHFLAVDDVKPLLRYAESATAEVVIYILLVVPVSFDVLDACHVSALYVIEFPLILNVWNEKHWLKLELVEQSKLMQVKSSDTFTHVPFTLPMLSDSCRVR